MNPTIKDHFDLNEALFSGRRHFVLVGPRGGGKLTKLRRMVGLVYGEMTLPQNVEKDGSPTKLVEQIRSGAMSAGTNAQFGFIVVDVDKAHFDEATQKGWHDSERVRYAFNALIRQTLDEYYSYASINRKLAVIFNFDNAPFAPDGVMFQSFTR